MNLTLNSCALAMLCERGCHTFAPKMLITIVFLHTSPFGFDHLSWSVTSLVYPSATRRCSWLRRRKPRLSEHLTLTRLRRRPLEQRTRATHTHTHRLIPRATQTGHINRALTSARRRWDWRPTPRIRRARPTPAIHRIPHIIILLPPTALVVAEMSIFALLVRPPRQLLFAAPLDRTLVVRIEANPLPRLAPYLTSQFRVAAAADRRGFGEEEGQEFVRDREVR